MRAFRHILLSTVTAAAALLAVSGRPATAAEPAITAGSYKHVLLISVDGMHAIDLTNWVLANPNSNLAALTQHGVVYPNAFTTAPSDSVPGMVAQVTGASPKTAQMFYDDSYDRTYYPSHVFWTTQGKKDPGCTGKPGTETTNFEILDKNFDFTNSVAATLDGGGTLGQPLTQIDPTHLQRRLVKGICTPVYPHEYIGANTIFEVAKTAGLRTAWSDKHPAYEFLNGPSGKGIDDLFAPEINSQLPATFTGAKPGDDYTKGFAAVSAYDSIKVQAVLNWIDGKDSTGKTKEKVPAIFGMNFQAVSVGQKLAKSGPGDAAGLTGGYLDSNATPGNALTQQLAFVDASVGKFKAELVKQGLDKSTLIIISAKHGQSPIDPADRKAQSDALFQAGPGFGTHGFEICDDEGLVWLQPESQKADYVAAEANLRKNAAALHIVQLLDRTSLAFLYGDPLKSNRVPDFIAVTEHGYICTGGSKLAEHGGFSDDDRNVVLLLSAPNLAPQYVENLVYTTQIAPTILTALGLDPAALIGVKKEGTPVLPH